MHYNPIKSSQTRYMQSDSRINICTTTLNLLNTGIAFPCCNWFLESSQRCSLPCRFHGDLLIIFSDIYTFYMISNEAIVCLLKYVCVCVFLCGGRRKFLLWLFLYSSRKSGNEPVSCCRSIRSLTSQLLLRYEKKKKKNLEKKTDNPLFFSMLSSHLLNPSISLFPP